MTENTIPKVIAWVVVVIAFVFNLLTGYIEPSILNFILQIVGLTITWYIIFHISYWIRGLIIKQRGI